MSDHIGLKQTIINLFLWRFLFNCLVFNIICFLNDFIFANINGKLCKKEYFQFCPQCFQHWKKFFQFTLFSINFLCLLQVFTVKFNFLDYYHQWNRLCHKARHIKQDVAWWLHFFKTQTSSKPSNKSNLWTTLHRVGPKPGNSSR